MILELHSQCLHIVLGPLDMSPCLGISVFRQSGQALDSDGLGQSQFPRPLLDHVFQPVPIGFQLQMVSDARLYKIRVKGLVQIVDRSQSQALGLIFCVC